MRRREFVASLALLPALALAPAAALAYDQADAMAAEAAMMSAANRAAQVRQIKKVPSVGVIDLRFRTVPRFTDNVPDISELQIYAQRNAGGIARLRKALAANSVTRAALAENGISIGRVVGVTISSRGSLRVYLL